jgi:amidase
LTAVDFSIVDTAGAWVPHGRFVLEPLATGPLSGLTFAVKDVFDVAGRPTGAGNPTWLATHDLPSEHSAVVLQLLQTGATLMGKVLTDELAYSLHGTNVHYGTPVNSAAPEQVTGGSSSGSTAAVAARQVDFALGTDTGGSTRVPASYAGLWGLRSTHGVVSTRGLVPLHPSFDTVTWLAHDSKTFERVGTVLLPASDFSARRLLILDDAWALADPVFAEPLHRVRDTLASLLPAQAETVRVSGAESLAGWRQIYATVGAHEGWAEHGAWIRQHRPRFGDAIGARWIAASEVSDEAAELARIHATRIRHRVRHVVSADVVAVLPSAASLAPRRDANPIEVDAVRLRTMAITCIAGLAGLPQVSIPLTLGDGSVLGVSLLGPPCSDLALIRLAVQVHSYLAGSPASMV